MLGYRYSAATLEYFNTTTAHPQVRSNKKKKNQVQLAKKSTLSQIPGYRRSNKGGRKVLVRILGTD